MATATADLNSARRVVLRPRSKETQEFTDIISRCSGSLYGQALRRLGNVEDAEDAVQDAFLSAYTHLDQFKGQAQMSTWLTTIVINAALMKVRRRPRQLHLSIDGAVREQNDLPLSEMLPDHRLNPEQECRRSEIAERLTRFSNRLSPTLRRAFLLREVDGLSIRETARLLGVPHGTVKARSARARAKLRRLVEKGLGGKHRML